MKTAAITYTAVLVDWQTGRSQVVSKRLMNRDAAEAAVREAQACSPRQQAPAIVVGGHDGMTCLDYLDGGVYPPLTSDESIVAVVLAAERAALAEALKAEHHREVEP